MVIKCVFVVFNVKLELYICIYYMLEVLGKFDVKDVSGKMFYDCVFD